MKDNQVKFKMTISKINVIKGGSVLSGKVEKGEITVGDKIKFKGVDGKQELEIKGIADNDTRKRIEKAGQDKNIGLFILENNCAQIGLQEGITIYMSEEANEEDYFSDLFGNLEEEKIEEGQGEKKEAFANQATIRIVIVYSDKLESISVDGIRMKDISAIQNIPIPNWFSEVGDRSGWKGLIKEIREMIDDNNVDLNFEFNGPRENKFIFEECISRFGFGNRADGMSKDAVARENLEEAQKAEHRKLYKRAFDYYLKAAEYGKLEEAQYKVGEYYYNFCEGDTKLDFDITIDEAISDAIKYYELAADKGNIEAQWKLYIIYSQGEYIEENLKLAIKWLKRAALGEKTIAQCTLGRIYYFGCSELAQDEIEAVSWYKKAAQKGDLQAEILLMGYYMEKDDIENMLIHCKIAAEGGEATAQCLLGEYYENIEQYDLAINWYKKAVEQRDAQAQYQLGMCYFVGKGVEENDDEAVKLFFESASQENEEGQNILGYCYEFGYGLEIDKVKAKELYEKSALVGNVEAQYNLGRCYEFGYDGKIDISQAIEWYKKAANQNNMYAQYRLGVCYEEGSGVEEDIFEAVEWYKKSAEQGHEVAQHSLGECYKEGLGVEKDAFKAVEWYKKSAEQGYEIAQYSLGECYEEGSGVEEDIFKAVEWYKKSAKQEYAQAQYQLGDCYEEGKGVEKNIAKAIELYLKSAEQGYAVAQYNLGLCYEFGEGVEQDFVKSAEWYEKSAEQGHAVAQYHLAYYYEMGKGVKKDISKAYELYKKSADNEYPYPYACLKLAEEYFEQVDKHFAERTGALVGVSIAIPITSIVTIPAAILGSAATSTIKMEKFLKTEKGKEMYKYYCIAADYGIDTAKKKLARLKAVMEEN